jgi:phosphocarrier protein
MVSKELTVINRAGMHARPSSLVVRELQKYKSEVYFEKVGRNSFKINAKSILGVITLGAAYGTKIIVSAEGPDEKAALAAVEKLFLSKFDEE